MTWKRATKVWKTYKSDISDMEHKVRQFFSHKGEKRKEVVEAIFEKISEPITNNNPYLQEVPKITSILKKSIPRQIILKLQSSKLQRYYPTRLMLEVIIGQESVNSFCKRTDSKYLKF